MLAALKAKIVFDRCRKARADRETAAQHPEGSENHAFYTLRAKFWADAADAAAKGDLTPRQFDLSRALDEALADRAEPTPTRAEGLPIVIVLVR